MWRHLINDHLYQKSSTQVPRIIYWLPWKWLNTLSYTKVKKNGAAKLCSCFKDLFIERQKIGKKTIWNFFQPIREKSFSSLSCNLAKCCRRCCKSPFLLRQHIAWDFEKFCFSFLFNWNILVSIFSGTLGKKTFPHNIPKPIFSPITFSLTPIPISAKCGRLAELPYWTENIRSKKHCLGSPVAFLQLQNYSQIQISDTTAPGNWGILIWPWWFGFRRAGTSRF